jgi:purine-binding chemotaxis protein CheW
MENTSLEETAADDLRQFVTFLLAEEVYGVKVEQVQEIISYQKFTKLPEQPSYMPGVFNLRGLVVPAIDLRLRFEMDSKEYDRNTVILVINTAGRTVGIVVDAVSDVLTLAVDDIQAPPEMRGGDQKEYVQALGKRGDEMFILLDVDRLLNDEELENLEGIAAASG